MFVCLWLARLLARLLKCVIHDEEAVKIDWLQTNCLHNTPLPFQSIIIYLYYYLLCHFAQLQLAILV